MRTVVTLVAALVLGGCVTKRGPDAGQVALDAAAINCGLPYLAGSAAMPNFREKMPRWEVDRRFGCLRDAIASTPAISGHRNLDAAARMIKVAEFAAAAVADGADPLLAEEYYSRELMSVKSTIAQRTAAEAAEEAEKNARVAAALSAFGSSMQQYGASMQQNQITPFSCTRFGNSVNCQ